VLDDTAIDAFHARPELRSALRRSLDRVLASLTRIRRSLRVLGEGRASRALLETLSDIYDEERRTGRGRISGKTFGYWNRTNES
jgi:hypothetical protein